MKYINNKNNLNKVLSKTHVALILSVLSIPFMQNATAQEVCDSTCVRNRPFTQQPLQARKSITPLTYPGNDYKVYNDFQTEVCPKGYQGRDGGVGYIYEKRSIVTFTDGKQIIGDWEALQDNCVPIPPPPPPPPPPVVTTPPKPTCPPSWWRLEYNEETGQYYCQEIEHGS